MRREKNDCRSLPEPRTKTTLRSLRWAALPALCLFLAPSAFAYCGADIGWLTFPQLTVASDGNQYTGVTGIGYGWEGRANIECDGLPRVKSWSLHPVLHVEGLDSLSFELYKAGKSYPAFQRPQNVHRTVGSIFPNVFVDDYATDACNLNLQLLMNQGYSRAQVLGQTRTIAAEFGGRLDVDITVGDPIIEGFGSQFTDIVCEKSPVQPPKPPKPASNDVTTTGELELDNANLIVFPSSYSGECPKDLTLFMEVQGNHKGTFEARIESTAGWKSTKTSLQTNEFDPGSGLWGREFSRPFTVPVEQPAPSGGGGGGIPPGPGNFQSPSLPEDPVFPGSTSPQAAGGFAPQNPGSNVHQQSLRLVAVANGKTVYSDWEQYRVTCDPKPAIQPATQAFLPGGTGGEPPKPDGTDPRPGSPQDDPKPGKPAKPTLDPQDAKPGRPSLDPAGQGAKEPAKAAPAPSKALPKTRQSAPAADAAPPSRTTPQSGVQAIQAVVARPDLRVVRARRSARSPEKVEILVENIGRAAAPKSSAQLTCGRAGGGSESWSAPVPALAVGGQVWIETAPEKARRVPTRVRGCEIVLDPTNVVDEANEGNNELSCGGCAAAGRAPGR